MTIRQILLSCISLSIFATPVIGYTQQAPLEILEQLIAYRNNSGIQNFLKTYGSLDYIDNQGQTALCRAIRRNDFDSYQILAKNGASRIHPCIQNMSISEKIAFDTGYKAYIRNLKIQYKSSVKSYAPVWWGIGGILSVGGIVALSGGGGGGSGNEFGINA